MNEPERYELVYNPVSGQPLGVTDLWQPQAMSVEQMAFRAGPPVYQPVVLPMQAPSPAQRWMADRTAAAQSRFRLYVGIAGAIFAGGLAVGCALFGDREPQAPVVMMCTSPVSYPFVASPNAAAPVQCATQQPGVPR